MNPQLRFFLRLRLAIYAVLILYLAGDFSLHGPFRRAFQKATSPRPPVVATVGDRSIDRRQLERATAAFLHRQGKTWDDLPPIDRKIARYSALGELIDSALIDREIAAAAPPPLVTRAEIDASLRRFRQDFASGRDLETAMKSQGIPDENALRARLATALRRQKFIDARLPAPTPDAIAGFREELRRAAADIVRIHHDLAAE